MTNQEKLAEAEAALHDLTLGNSVRVLVDQNGERIEYTAASRGKLAQYVAELRKLTGVQVVTGPLMVYF